MNGISTRALKAPLPPLPLRCRHKCSSHRSPNPVQRLQGGWGRFGSCHSRGNCGRGNEWQLPPSPDICVQPILDEVLVHIFVFTLRSQRQQWQRWFAAAACSMGAHAAAVCIERHAAAGGWVSVHGQGPPFRRCQCWQVCRSQHAEQAVASRHHVYQVVVFATVLPAARVEIEHHPANRSVICQRVAKDNMNQQ